MVDCENLLGFSQTKLQEPVGSDAEINIKIHLSP